LFKNGWLPANKTYLDLFVQFLPFAWLQNVLLPKMSNELEIRNRHSLTLSEIMRFIGIRLLMATIQGWSTSEF
jgi:hypothetical protein